MMDTEERDIWTGCALVIFAVGFGLVCLYFAWKWIG